MDSVLQNIEKLSSSDQVQVYQADLALREAIARAKGPELQKIASTLASELNATREEKDDKGKVRQVIKYDAKTRSKIARHLAMAGGDEEVPALVQAIQDLDVREMARWTLDRMTCPAATAALVQAAQEAVGPDFRIGAINALGRRSGSEVVSALKACAADPSLEIRIVAAEALANHPDSSSDTAIVEAAQGNGILEERARVRLSKARIRLAETLVRNGNPQAGKKIYQAILTGQPEEPQKEAALRALQKIS
ncbi:MAG: HEAT repeat domain-containing protein [Planctomycetota bacterium]